MADLSNSRRSPALIVGGVVQAAPSAARFVLRGGPEALSAAGNAIGLSMSQSACRSVTSGDRAALWLGPDEQLIIAPPAEGAVVLAQLTLALALLPHSVVDVSHRQIALQLSGPHAQQLLSAGCPLDLHLPAFPVGMCTRTVLGKAEIVLWRTAPEIFHVEVWRSFAEYATRFLAEAMRELAG